MRILITLGLFAIVSVTAGVALSDTDSAQAAAPLLEVDGAEELSCESPLEAASQADSDDGEALVCDDIWCDNRCNARGCLVGICDPRGPCRCFVC